MDHHFDPWAVLEQLQINQKQLDLNMQNVVMMTNQNTKRLQDHEERLDLNQATINQILASLQNQQKLLMGLFDMMVEVRAVNSDKGPDLNDQTSTSSQN